MFTQDEIDSIKVKKLATLLERGSNVVTSKIKIFIDETNASLEKFKTRHENMYNHLIKVFLVNLEKRIYSTEVIQTAFMEVSYIEFYEIYKKSLQEGEEAMTFEEFTKRTNERVQAHVTKNEEKAKADRLKEAQANESVQKED